MSVKEDFKSVFQKNNFKGQVRIALAAMPEIKLEDHINNLLAIALFKQGKKYYRELYSKKFMRFADLATGTTRIEVKYRFEGDVITIQNFLSKNNNLNCKNIKRSLNNIVSTKSNKGPILELLIDYLRDAHYFIWHISIREKNYGKPIYPRVYSTFYKAFQQEKNPEVEVEVDRIIKQEINPILNKARKSACLKISEIRTTGKKKGDYLTHLFIQV